MVQILCWYHLRKRIYESLGAVGLAKAERELLEHEILGLLWKGKTAQVVWILWELRSEARVPKRIDDLMGYLLRKKRLIVDYETRRGEGLWLASTRVEGWNDTAVADRCKDMGASWTASGVLGSRSISSTKNTHELVNARKFFIPKFIIYKALLPTLIQALRCVNPKTGSVRRQVLFFRRVTDFFLFVAC